MVSTSSIPGPEKEGLVFHGDTSRHGDDCRLQRFGALGSDPTGGFHSVHLGHVNVHQDHVVLRSTHRSERFDTVPSDISSLIELAKQQQYDFSIDLVVVGDEQPQPHLLRRPREAAQTRGLSVGSKGLPESPP
jgi:hypothetical protein